jgi:hypothetical protein
MTKTTTNSPRLTETADGGCVELADGVRIRWRCGGDGGKWQVWIESDTGLDVLGVHHEKATVPLH